MRVRLRMETFVNEDKNDKLRQWISDIVERVASGVLDRLWSYWDLKMYIDDTEGVISIEAFCRATTDNEHRIKLDVVRSSDTIYTVYVDYIYDGSRYGSCCGLCSDVFGIDLSSMECAGIDCHEVELDTPIGRKLFKIVEYETSTPSEWDVKPDEMIAKWIEDDKIVVGKCKYSDYREFTECESNYGDNCEEILKGICKKLSVYNRETDPYGQNSEQVQFLTWRLESEEERRPQTV